MYFGTCVNTRNMKQRKREVMNSSGSKEGGIHKWLEGGKGKRK